MSLHAHNPRLPQDPDQPNLRLLRPAVYKDPESNAKYVRDLMEETAEAEKRAAKKRAAKSGDRD
jgi:hypothetical protein